MFGINSTITKKYKKIRESDKWSKNDNKMKINPVNTLKSCLYFILHGISLLVLILGTLENIFDQGGHLEYGAVLDHLSVSLICLYFFVIVEFIPNILLSYF